MKRHNGLCVATHPLICECTQSALICLLGRRADPHAFNVAADDNMFKSDLERLTSTVAGLTMVADNSDKLVEIATATLASSSTSHEPEVCDCLQYSLVAARKLELLK